MQHFIGQFWNIPYKVENFDINSDINSTYAITVDSTKFSGEARSFVSLLYARPGEIMLPCLFTGDRQGGATNAFDDPNDSVLQGSFEDYEVSDLFDTNFKFSVFNSTICGS